MKNLIKLSLVGVVVILYSCSPKVNSSIANSNYPKLDPNTEIIVLATDEKVPDKSEFIGDLKIGDSGFSTDCGFKKVMQEAKDEARRNGANLLEIMQIKEPNFGSTCYRLKAKMYRNTDPDAMSEFISNREIRGKSRLPSDAEYAIVYFYRPQNFYGSAIGYKIRIDDETVIGRVRNGEKFEFKTTDFGEHTFWAKTEAANSVVINIEKGQEYFVRCSIVMRAAVGRPQIELTDNFIRINEYENIN